MGGFVRLRGSWDCSSSDLFALFSVFSKSESPVTEIAQKFVRYAILVVQNDGLFTPRPWHCSLDLQFAFFSKRESLADIAQNRAIYCHSGCLWKMMGFCTPRPWHCSSSDFQFSIFRKRESLTDIAQNCPIRHSGCCAKRLSFYTWAMALFIGCAIFNFPKRESLTDIAQNRPI